MRTPFTLVLLLCASLNTYADRDCGLSFGPQDDLSKTIKVVPHEYEMYEIYLPLKYRGVSLSFVEALIKDGEGNEGYFQLSYQEKPGSYYLHLSLEPISNQVTISANYGVGECNYQGRVTLKRNKSSKKDAQKARTSS